MARYAALTRLQPREYPAQDLGVEIPIMRLKSWIIAGLVLGVLAATSFGSSSKGEKAMTLELKSAAFTPGSDIPKKFTCDGPDVSPALSWSELPANTQRDRKSVV